MMILNILNILVERPIMMTMVIYKICDCWLMFLSYAVSFDFGRPIFYLYASKKCGQSVYIRTFGLGLPSLPIYAECPHRYVRTFAIFRKVNYNGPRLNVSSIKQMLIYVCCLSADLCHRRGLYLFYLYCL